MRLAIVTGVILFFAVKAFPQGTLKGKITDSASRQPLGLATITVFKAADTAIITYRLSTPEGEFKIPGLPLDINCRAVISFSGYRVYRKEFTLTAAQPQLDWGTIALPANAQSLDEVLVVAERPPVTVRRDTIEFNASAFKTIPNALVEDLLKKLPGVQVDKDGNILVNGKPVNRIMVDGKSFFGDDPKMATRNLPANVIDKVQVTDDKEELLRNGDDNVNNVGKVINITLKKGVKKGWFGKLYAGGGTDERYEGGGIANIFRDTLQVSVLDYMNNLNKPGFGFSDLMQTGGFARNRDNSNSNSISIWNNSGGGSSVSINGVNFGGLQQGGGIASSKGAGFNLNHAPDTKKSFFMQYFYGNAIASRQSTTDVNQYNADTVVNNHTGLNGDLVTNAHNIGLGARLKPDSLTNLLVNVNYTIGLQDENKYSGITSNNNKLGQLSNGNIGQFNQSNTYYYRHNVSFTRLSKTKKGRRFTVNQTVDVNNRFNDYITDSRTNFYYPVPSDSMLLQLRSERVPRTDVTGNFNYSEPISKAFTLRFGGRYEYGKLDNGVTTFNKPDSNSKEYNLYNAALSSHFSRESNRFNLSTGFEFKWKGFTFTPGIRAQGQYVNNRPASLPAVIKQQRFDILPSLSVVYKRLNFNYNKDISLPGYNYLIPVSDNTNPYYITRGNPGLEPSVKQNISVNCNFNDTKRSLNLFLYANGSLINKDIVQSTTIDDKGIQTNIPVNVNGSRNFYVNYGINKQYKTKQNFIFSWNTGANYNYNRNRLLYNGESSWQSTFSFSQWVGINLNWNDKFEWNSNGSYNYNFTQYTSAVFKKLEVRSYNIENELILRWPKHVIWETQTSYNYNSNLPAGYDKSIIRWNAAVNFTMLKDETGVLRLSVFDILNTNKNIYMFASRNTTTTSQSNVLPQYFMATFTYNIRPFGARKKVGGRERLFFF